MSQTNVDVVNEASCTLSYIETIASLIQTAAEAGNLVEKEVATACILINDLVQRATHQLGDVKA